ncbi:hypothetical protein ABZ599_16485 [Streptomyces misionensis]
MVERTRTHAQMHSQPGFRTAFTTPLSRSFLLRGHRTSLVALTEEDGMS